MNPKRNNNLDDKQCRPLLELGLVKHHLDLYKKETPSHSRFRGKSYITLLI